MFVKEGEASRTLLFTDPQINLLLENYSVSRYKGELDVVMFSSVA